MRFKIKSWWNVLCWTGILSLPLAVSGCHSSTFVTMSGGSSTSVSVSNDRTTVKIKKPEYELEFECKGKWTFASDESDLASGDPNTKAELIEVSNGIRQSYRIESDSHGELTRSYWRAGKLVEMDEAASAWLKDAIARLFSESSFQAKERTERMLSEGQEDKLFAAIETSRDQFTKSIYLQSVVEYPELNLELFQKTIQFATKMNSDFDRAELLNKAAKRISESKEYQQAWLKGLEAFQSDFDLARVIRTASNEKRLEKSFVESLMTIAAEKMQSDFELKGRWSSCRVELKSSIWPRLMLKQRWRSNPILNG